MNHIYYFLIGDVSMVKWGKISKGTTTPQVKDGLWHRSIKETCLIQEYEKSPLGGEVNDKTEEKRALD